MPIILDDLPMDKKIAKYFDTLVSIYFQNVGTDKLEKGMTLGEFMVTAKPIYPQYVLDWMEESD